MPQIGWFEILIIVVLAVLIIGPKVIPIVLKKIGGWVGSLKKYYNEIQQNVTNIETEIEDQIDITKDFSNKDTKENKEKK